MEVCTWCKRPSLGFFATSLWTLLGSAVSLNWAIDLEVVAVRPGRTKRMVSENTYPIA
jgi:hypothetical protein